MDVRAAARAWVDGWSKGWRAHDVDVIAQLYAPDATFVSEPSRDIARGPEGVRGYARQAFAEEDTAEFRFGTPIVNDDRAALEYWALITLRGETQTLVAVALLRFAADGRVREQHDIRTMREGRHEPPQGFA